VGVGDRRLTLIDPQDLTAARRALGARLAVLRDAAGYTQKTLAPQVFCSRSTVANIETGHHAGTRDFWTLCDQVLHADSALVAAYEEYQALVAAQRQEAVAKAKRPLTRLGLTVPGSDGLTDDDWDRLLTVVRDPRRADAQVVGHLTSMLSSLRHTEDLIGAGPLVEPVRAQLELTENVGRHAKEPIRKQLLNVAAEQAELLGWMLSDVGEPIKANAAYDQAMEWAQRAGNHNMIASVLSLKSHLAWASGNGMAVIDLACAATREPQKITPGVMALALQQEARGHAMVGTADLVDARLDDAIEATAIAKQHAEDEPPWIYFASLERLVGQRAIAYTEIDRAEEAVDLLTQAITTLPAELRRDRGRYLAQQALAHGVVGNVPEAFSTARAAAALAVETGSGHTLRTLRQLRRRYDGSKHPAITEFDAYVREHLSGQGRSA